MGNDNWMLGHLCDAKLQSPNPILSQIGPAMFRSTLQLGLSLLIIAPFGALPTSSFALKCPSAHGPRGDFCGFALGPWRSDSSLQARWVVAFTLSLSLSLLLFVSLLISLSLSLSLSPSLSATPSPQAQWSLCCSTASCGITVGTPWGLSRMKSELPSEAIAFYSTSV